MKLWEEWREIAGPLAEIFVSLTAIGEVLEDSRMAGVVPLVKNACHEKSGNNRSMRLTSVLDMVLDRILRGSIQVHLKRQGLIRNNQHGFVHEKSWLTNFFRRSDPEDCRG